MQECDLFANDMREVYEGRVERLNVTASEIFEKATQGYEMICLSDNLEIFGAVCGAVAIELEPVFAE